jgi:hypothetical protein
MMDIKSHQQVTKRQKWETKREDMSIVRRPRLSLGASIQSGTRKRRASTMVRRPTVQNGNGTEVMIWRRAEGAIGSSGPRNGKLADDRRSSRTSYRLLPVSCVVVQDSRCCVRVVA